MNFNDELVIAKIKCLTIYSKLTQFKTHIFFLLRNILEKPLMTYSKRRFSMLIRIFIFLFLLSNGFCLAFEEDLEIAKAIVESRICFYQIRGGLLTGTDEISIEFQRAICNQGEGAVHLVPSLSTPGAAEDLIGMLFSMAGRTKDSEFGSFLKNAQALNAGFIRDWRIIQEKINALQTMGIQESSMREFDEFLDDIMPRRGMVVGCKKVVAAPKKGRKFKTSKAVVEDMGQIARDLKDLKDIRKLLEPHFLDACEHFITGTVSVVRATGMSSKKGRHKQAESKPTLYAMDPISVDVMASLPIATSGLIKNDLSVEKEVCEAAVSKITEELDEDSDDQVDFDLKFFGYSYPKTQAVNNPKLARQMAKEKGIAAAALSESITIGDAKIDDVALPIFTLKPKHKATLESILGVSSHPPKWRKAISAIRAIMQYTGGSYCGSLGNGSSVEFWLGKIRFLVDSSHGAKDPAMMYPDQIKFMKYGLERAGITLEVIKR